MTKRWVFYLVILASLGIFITILALPGPSEASPSEQEQDQPLRVVTKEIEPFVFK